MSDTLHLARGTTAGDGFGGVVWRFRADMCRNPEQINPSSREGGVGDRCSGCHGGQGVAAGEHLDDVAGGQFGHRPAGFDCGRAEVGHECDVVQIEKPRMNVGFVFEYVELTQRSYK